MRIICPTDHGANHVLWDGRLEITTRSRTRSRRSLWSLSTNYLIVPEKGQGEIVIRRDEVKEGEEVLVNIFVVQDTKG